MLKYGPSRSTIKRDHSLDTQTVIKKLLFSPSIRMSGKNINFDDQRVNKK